MKDPGDWGVDKIVSCSEGSYIAYFSMSWSVMIVVKDTLKHLPTDICTEVSK